MNGVCRVIYKIFWSSNSCEHRSRRYMSAAQAVAALRPFYFAVHPDLFGRYPEVRQTNENSLKVFNGYLDELYLRRPQHHVKSIELKFYLRSKPNAMKGSAISAPFESVVVTLNHKDPSTIIRQVLETCHLETVHLPPRTSMTEEMISYEEDEKLKQFYKRKTKASDETFLDIEARVEKLISKAESISRTQDIFEMEINKTINSLKLRYGIQGVVWQSGWTLNHCKGCLQLFSRVIDSYSIPLQNLSGWRIKFGRGIFVSVDGCIVLGVDDVPEDWCRLLLNLSPKENYLSDLNQLEATLSRFLNNAIVTGQSDDSIVRYKSWLKAMVDRFQTYEKSHRVGLQDFSGKFENVCIVIVTDSSSLSLDDQGRILVPSSTSPTKLIQFLKDNCEKVQDRRMDYLNLFNENANLKLVCIDKLELKDLSWDSFLSLSAVKESLIRLSNSSNISILRGHKVHISRSYTVMPNGAISIPVGFHCK